MNYHSKAARNTFLLFAILSLICLTPLASHAASSAVTIKTNQSSYPAGTETITVSGNVTPVPGQSGTFVAISITSPNGALTDANQFSVSPTTGAFNGTFTTGGPTYNVQGTYTIKAVYNNATASEIFQYGNTTTSSSSSQASGTATTTTVAVTTTVVSQVQTTVTQAQATTVTQVQQQQTTVTSQVNYVTTVSASAGSSSTALAVGAVGVVIAIIASVLAVMAMRRK